MLGANEGQQTRSDTLGVVATELRTFIKLFSEMVINDLGWGEETSFSVARKSDQSRAHASQSPA
jgi:hypothetical protein